MKYSKHSIAAVAVMAGALLSSCAGPGSVGYYNQDGYKTAAPLESENTQNPDAPNVVISRYNASPYLMQARIYINDVEQVRLKNKEYAELSVEPGVHLIEIKFNPLSGQRGTKQSIVVPEDKVLGLNIVGDVDALAMVGGVIFIKIEEENTTLQARRVKNCCTKVDVK